jgi:hypothetical protein
MDSRLCSHRRVQNHLELSVTHSSELAAVDDRTVTNAGGERISQDAFLVRQRTRTDVFQERFDPFSPSTNFLH